MNKYFEIRSNGAMERAIERAKVNKPKARIINAENRIFQVDSIHGSKTYEISFSVNNGKKFAACRCIQTGESCKGLTATTVCYHVAIAAGVNMAIRQEMAKAKECVAPPIQPKVETFDPAQMMKFDIAPKAEKLGGMRI